jgi:hypothetical protein
MRLINVISGQFEEFIGSNIPKYAILSHTWESEEVSFQDMKSTSYKDKKGFQKIQKTCEIAAAAGIKHVWVDTCCIDKSSSAELTEAINSMFRWYQRAEVCYAYLSDLPPLDPDLVLGALRECRWFTRGWTLQELIAPYEVLFFDQHWSFRGSKTSVDFVALLSNITGIQPGILRHTTSLLELSTAHKMSWAAHRRTTRIEDTAYCLLGIFDVNMPLLYGEEDKAFQRLQEEIIKSGTDCSIFAWRLPNPPPRQVGDNRYCGILAKSPLSFSGCNFEKVAWTQDLLQQKRDMSVSNSRVRIQTPLRLISRLLQHVNEAASPFLLLPVDCRIANKSSSVLGVRLRCYGSEKYMRINPWDLVEMKDCFNVYAPGLGFSVTKDRYLLSHLPEPWKLHTPAHLKEWLAHAPVLEQPSSDVMDLMSHRNNVVRILLDDSGDVSIADMVPQGLWDPEDRVVFSDQSFDDTFSLLRLRGFYILNSSDPLDLVNVEEKAALTKTSPGTQDNASEHLTGTWEAIFYARISSEWSDYDSTYVLAESPIESALWMESKALMKIGDHHGVEVLLKRQRSFDDGQSIRMSIPKTELFVRLSFFITTVKDTGVSRSEFEQVEFLSTIENAVGERISGQ